MLGQYSFAVVDVETTGLFPTVNDRIVEIAVVSLQPSSDEPKDEFVTLVNPERDVGPTRIHGISARDVLHAPRFREIAGEIASRLAGAVLVAHNARFDVGFLEAELGRVVERHPPLATLCTMTLARQIEKSAPSYRLHDLCAHLGVMAPIESHSALHDARATALLFGALLRRALSAGVNSLRGLCCSCEPAPADTWPSLPTGGPTITRQHAQERGEPSYLARLVSRLHAEPVHRNAETLEYVDLLDRALEDRVVTEAEAEGLVETATRWGLSRERVLAVHQAYFEALARASLADGVVTPAERADLEPVARLLGQDIAVLDSTLETARADGPRPGYELPNKTLAGLSVCFTGESRLTFQGEPLTRAMAEDLATKAGLVVKKNVSKSLDVLVVVDAHSQSAKASKAKRFGTRIIAEKVFWDMLRLPMG